MEAIMDRIKYGWIIATALVFCFGGCQTSDKTSEKPDQIIPPTVDEQKTALLNQIEKRYESPEAHYQLGKLYYNDGMFDKSEFEYRVALGFEPVHYRAQAALVNVLKAKNEKNQSGVIANMYINQASVSAEALFRLGKAFQNEGLDEYALNCYQQAQSLAPDSAILYKQIGYYYLAKGDTVRAEENLRHSFQLDPYQTEVASELGRMGVMVQIPQKPAKENFLKKLFKKDEASQEQEPEQSQEQQ